MSGVISGLVPSSRYDGYMMQSSGFQIAGSHGFQPLRRELVWHGCAAFELTEYLSHLTARMDRVICDNHADCCKPYKLYRAYPLVDGRSNESLGTIADDLTTLLQRSNAIEVLQEATGKIVIGI